QARNMGGQVRPHDSISHAPAGHGIGFGKSIEQDGATFEAVERHDGMVLAFKKQAAINFVGQDHDFAVADGGGDVTNIALAQHTASGILGRVNDDELGAIVDEVGEFIHIQAKIHFFAQLDGNSLGADKVDHGFVDRESWIGIDDLVAGLNQRQNGEEDDGLAAGNNDHLFWTDGNAAA